MEDWPWPQGPLIDLTGDEDGGSSGSGITLDLSRVFLYIFMSIFSFLIYKY
jgi:hypothetical protein